MLSFRENQRRISEMLNLTSVKSDQDPSHRWRRPLFLEANPSLSSREKLDDELFATTLCNTWPRLVDRNMHSETCQLAGICKS
jgi:hypothetical protein